MILQRIIKAISLILLISIITIPLSSCGEGSKNLTVNMAKGSPSDTSSYEQDGDILAGICIDLFASSYSSGKSSHSISPLSAIICLSMIANGASGSTLEQIESLFGMDIDELNETLCSFSASLEQNDNLTIDLANSLWLKNDGTLQVREDFLKSSAAYYGADVFSAPFDGSTVKDINKWVKSNTDGKIKELLTELPQDAVACIINTLLFDAEWESKIEKKDISQKTFYNADGTSNKVSMMYSSERLYYDFEGTLGFRKQYKGYDISFIGLLPPEGTDIGEFVSSMDGELWNNILQSASTATVHASFPQFSITDDISLIEPFQKMGITDLFSESEADLSRLGSMSDGRGLFCSQFKQKITVEVDGSGTKAAAASVGIMAPTSAEPPRDVVYVTLDRPFVYAIIDNATGTPLFIGCIENLK